MHQKRAAAYRRSIIVALILAALTVVEYYAAVLYPELWIVLVLLAIAKAALVVNYFMHVSRLWSQSEEH
jgi:cytochrome c oxidase subunit IV